MNAKLIAAIALASIALASCGSKTVYVDRVIKVNVPVAAPCMGTAPDPVEMLREQIPRDEWDALTTDQRENLIAAAALAWRIFGWQATDASAGCK